MTSLESLVPSLDLCRQLQAAGFPQDTAMVWERSVAHIDHPVGVHVKGDNSVWGGEDFFEDICAAPTAGEMEEWLRGKVGNPLEETTVIVSHDGSKEVAYCAGVHSAKGEYQIAYNDTNVSALATLVLEVTK